MKVWVGKQGLEMEIDSGEEFLVIGLRPARDSQHAQAFVKARTPAQAARAACNYCKWAGARVGRPGEPLERYTAAGQRARF
jgi:hypothetical protein